jgi:hypothetical protein
MKKIKEYGPTPTLQDYAIGGVIKDLRKNKDGAVSITFEKDGEEREVLLELMTPPPGGTPALFRDLDACDQKHFIGFNWPCEWGYSE